MIGPGPKLTVIGLTALMAVAILVSTGCDSSRAANVRLRDRVHALEQENKSLRQETDELQAHLETSMASSSSPVTGAEQSAIPLVTTIAIDGSSGRAGQPDTSGGHPLEVHVLAKDGLGRPIQLAGRLQVRAVLVEEGMPAVEIGSITLLPRQLRDAWRNGMLAGPTWLATIPLDETRLPPAAETVYVKVVYEDLRTGQRLTCGEEVDVR